MNTSTTKRASVRQILNRDKVYSLRTYARKISKRVGRIISTNEIKTCLTHMKKEGQITFRIVNDRYVVGFSTRAVA